METLWRRELAVLSREQARLAEAVAAPGDIPILITRLRDTERRRVELMAQPPTLQRPRASWADIERRMRARLTDCRPSLISVGGRPGSCSAIYSGPQRPCRCDGCVRHNSQRGEQDGKVSDSGFVHGRGCKGID